VNFALIPQFESAHNNTRLGFKSGSTIIDSRRRDQSSASLVRRKFTDKQQGIQIGWTDWCVSFACLSRIASCVVRRIVLSVVF
jgi:hypothetical protein